MQNKGAILVLAVTLVVVSIYQLSFKIFFKKASCSTVSPIYRLCIGIKKM